MYDSINKGGLKLYGFPCLMKQFTYLVCKRKANNLHHSYPKVNSNIGVALRLQGSVWQAYSSNSEYPVLLWKGKEHRRVYYTQGHWDVLLGVQYWRTEGPTALW